MTAALDQFKTDFPAPVVEWRPYSEIGKTPSDPVLFLTSNDSVTDNYGRERIESGELKFEITHFLTAADVLALPRPAVKTERGIAEEEFEIHWRAKDYKFPGGRLYAFDAWMAARGFTE